VYGESEDVDGDGALFSDSQEHRVAGRDKVGLASWYDDGALVSVENDYRAFEANDESSVWGVRNGRSAFRLAVCAYCDERVSGSSVYDFFLYFRVCRLFENRDGFQEIHLGLPVVEDVYLVRREQGVFRDRKGRTVPVKFLTVNHFTDRLILARKSHPKALK
jgi:hypothetical protein